MLEQRRQRRVDVRGVPMRDGVERRHDALGEAGQHLAGADLVDVGDAVGRHGGDAFAPAHGAGHLLDQARAISAGSLIGAASTLATSGTAGALDRRPSASASAMASAAGCISAQWKGALTAAA